MKAVITDEGVTFIPNCDKDFFDLGIIYSQFECTMTSGDLTPTLISIPIDKLINILTTTVKLLKT